MRPPGCRLRLRNWHKSTPYGQPSVPSSRSPRRYRRARGARPPASLPIFSGGKFFARLQELSREKEDMFEVEVNRFTYVRQKDLRLPRVFDRRGLRVLRTSDMRARRFANKQTVLFAVIAELAALENEKDLASPETFASADVRGRTLPPRTPCCVHMCSSCPSHTHFGQTISLCAPQRFVVARRRAFVRRAHQIWCGPPLLHCSSCYGFPRGHANTALR